MTGRCLVMAMLLAAGVVACTDDDGDTDPAASDDPTATTVAPATMEPAVATTERTRDLSVEERAEFETASEFAQCLREHGIEGFPDPQVSDNGFLLVGVPLDGSSWTGSRG